LAQVKDFCVIHLNERLEEFHIAVTGLRRYAEFDTFRRTLRRYLDSCSKASV
jgi:hypothetical protein